MMPFGLVGLMRLKVLLSSFLEMCQAVSSMPILFISTFVLLVINALIASSYGFKLSQTIVNNALQLFVI